MFQAVSDGRRVRDTVVANYFTKEINRLNINVFIIFVLVYLGVIH